MMSRTDKPWPFPTSTHHPPAQPGAVDVVQPSEKALDHGIEESFPASDPPSVGVTVVRETPEGEGTKPANKTPNAGDDDAEGAKN
jgi:hypothetical protein